LPVIQVGSTVGANPFALRGAKRRERNKEIDLFHQKLDQIDFLVFIENIFHFFVAQRNIGGGHEI
jgi:hypothetical protein